MSEPSQTFLMLGLPKTGKTTFLAALDEVLENPTPEQKLRSASFAKDRNYITRIKAQWLGGQEIPRSNPSDGNAMVSLKAKDTESGSILELILPDTLGETYRRQCEDREWTATFRDKLSAVNGILLFINCIHGATHEPLSEEFPLLPPDVKVQKPDEKKGIKWENKHAARQVKVVELLQFLRNCENLRKPVKVAVMVSAWDIVQKEPNRLPQKPTEFVAREWPLLGQFLATNSLVFHSKIFGVSAQGCDLKDKEFLNRVERPCERVLLVDDNHESRDLTAPLKWLLNQAS